MKPKSVVTCLPTRNLKKAHTFYSECFKLTGLEIQDDILTIELGNLSLFVMGQEAYEKYTQKASLRAGYPQDGLQVLHSCGVDEDAIIAHVFATADKFGGTVAGKMRRNEWGQDAGYIRDPDGHLWEIVRIAKS